MANKAIFLSSVAGRCSSETHRALGLSRGNGYPQLCDSEGYGLSSVNLNLLLSRRGTDLKQGCGEDSK